MPRLSFVPLMLCALLPGVALRAADPKVAINGPHAATVGTMLFLDVSDSVSDKETPLSVGFGEPSATKPPTVKVISDNGAPTILRLLPVEAGSFNLVVSATGKPAADAPTVTRYAVWPIMVTATPIPPPPPPLPDPNPPGPLPPPTPPLPTPTSIGQKLGQQFTPQLAASLADGFDTAATMIAAGTTVREADEALKAKFQAARSAAFAPLVTPAYTQIVPDGGEPKDAATRAALAQFHRDFARGLRGAP